MSIVMTEDFYEPGIGALLIIVAPAPHLLLGSHTCTITPYSSLASVQPLFTLAACSDGLHPSLAYTAPSELVAYLAKP